MTTSIVDSMVDLRGGTRARRSESRRVSRDRLERAHADQVVRRRGQQKLPVHAASAAVAELAQTTHRLHSAEDLFNPFPRALADRVAWMPGRAGIERATVRLLRDVGRGVELSQRVHKAAGVVAFVAADGYPSPRQTGDEA